MSSFSDSNFAKRLSELNNTQQSIQTLSLWLIHHRKHSKTIVQVWFREMQKVPPNRKLTFMYLANDVIQNSKKKGPDFAKDFGSVLPDAYKDAIKSADEKIQKSLDRILSIWQDRGVYDSNFVSNIKAGTAATYQPQPYLSKKKRDKQKRNSNTVQQSTPDPVPPPVKKKKKEEVSLLDEIQALVKQNSSEPPPDAEELVKRLCDLEHSASSDAAVREKIAALPPEVSDIQHLSKISDKESAIQLSRQVDDACLLLSEYNKRLGAELEERKLVGKMLREFISAQKDQLKHTETKLQEYKSRLTKVTSVRQELQSHLQKLPDLTLLPDITGGLAPLPTAGDLFSVDQRF